MRLAILTTHPIQYYAPVFALLAQVPGLELRVFYGWKGSVEGGHDRDFGQDVQWDIPLLEGYEFEFVENVSRDPGTHHFGGIDLPSLHDRITAWKPDALLVYGWSFKAHLKAIRHFHRKIAICFRGDSNLLDERPGWRRLLRRAFLRRVYASVDIAFYVGTENRRYFEAMGLRPEQLVFAPHAVDNERFHDVSGGYEKEAMAWRAELGIPDDYPVALYVGKFQPKKGPLDLLEAHQNLSPDSPLHLVFAGSGDLEESLRAAAGEKVHFIGFQNQSRMPVVYRLGDLVVLPSRGPGETWGLAINEAMACGRAVAVSDRVGCAVDLVHAGRNGWMFAAGDTGSLEAVLQQAVGNGREALTKMGAASFSLILDWSLEHQVACITKGVLTKFSV